MELKDVTEKHIDSINLFCLKCGTMFTTNAVFNIVGNNIGVQFGKVYCSDECQAKIAKQLIEGK